MYDIATFVLLIIGSCYLLSSHPLKGGEKENSETQAKLTLLKAQLKAREDDLQQRELSLKKRVLAIEEQEKDLKRRIEENQQNEKASAEPDRIVEVTKTVSVALGPESSPEETESVTSTPELEQEPSSVEQGTIEVTSSPPKPSEGEMRNKMIDEELTRLVKEAEENELEEAFDEDSLEALKKAAFKICYLKKYYDVLSDKIIYFPSVRKTLINYSLIEEAEKFYFEEEDEYPQDLTIALRTVATESLMASDDDTDEEYMSKMALDVVIWIDLKKDLFESPADWLYLIIQRDFSTQPPTV